VHYSVCKGQSVQSKSFVYSACLCPTDNEVKSCVDTDDSSSVEKVNEFW